MRLTFKSIPVRNLNLRQLKKLPTAALRLAVREWVLSLSLILSAIIGLVTVAFVVAPAYVHPSNRMYLSRLGHARVLRQQGKPFNVEVTRPKLMELSSTSLGEGLVQSEPILVPIIPMGRVEKVYVEVGDCVTKGQLLAEIDDEIAVLKVEAARAAVAAAKEEYERIRIGSVYQLVDERPERERIRLQERETQYQIQLQLVESTKRLVEKGAATQNELNERQLELAKAEMLLQETKWSLDAATNGIEHSIEIARLAVEDTTIALAHRETDLKNHKIYAPADGVIERALLHEGEYNQDPGKPGFLIASGLWFNAHFNQTNLGFIKEGDTAEIHLAAFAGEVIKGRIVKVAPIVSYNLGGPENNRPIRPLGTGAPEWPATFGVQIQIVESSLPIVPGLTGFAKVDSKRVEVALPMSAVKSISARTGLLFVVDGEEYQPRRIKLGYASDGYIGVRDGIQLQDIVISDGHQILEPGDAVRVTNTASLPAWNPCTSVFQSCQLERESEE